MLLCTDDSRLLGSISPEIIAAIREVGVRVVTADGTEIGMADLVAHTLTMQSATTVVEEKRERIKKGKRASKAAGPKKRLSPKK